jgi:hypothetical protein
LKVLKLPDGDVSDVPTKHWLTFGNIFQKTELFITTTVRISNLTWSIAPILPLKKKKKNPLHGLSPLANYTG